MSTIATLVVKLVADTTGLQSGVTEAQNRLKGIGGTVEQIGNKVSGVGQTMTMGITAPLIGAGVAMTKVAGDFEEQMNILSTAANTTEYSLEDLSDAAIAVGADTRLVGIDAAQSAGAMTNFYKAGLDTADIFGDLEAYLEGNTELTGALRAAIDMAAASNLDLASASDVVSIAMATYGLEADDAVDISNNFVQAADASVASVSELAESMTNVGPTAAAFGWDLEQTNTALAILSQRGIRGGEAGTALKSMMTNLMRGTDDVVDTLRDLNVQLYDADGNMRSLPDILSSLESGMAGLTEEQRNSAIQTLAGTYGMKAMQTLLSEGTQGWINMEDAIASASDAQETAKARTKGWNAAFETFKGVMETLLIKVGVPFLNDFLTPLIQRITELTEKFISLSPEQQRQIMKWLGIAAALGPILIIVGKVITFIGTLITIAGTLGVSLSGLLLPIALIIGAMTLLYLAWKNNWGGIREKTAAAILWIRTKIQEFIEAVKAWWAAHGDDVIATALRLWQGIKDAFNRGVEFVKRVIATGLEIFNNFWDEHGQAIMLIVMNTWMFIKRTIDRFQKIIGHIMDAFQAAKEGDWYEFGEHLRKAWDEVWRLIKDAVQTGVRNILIEFGHLWPKLKEWFNSVDWGQLALDIINGLVVGLATFGYKFQNAITNLASNALQAAKGFLGIDSPSKAFEYIGNMSVQGMIEPFYNTSVIEDAVSMATAAMMPSMSEMTFPIQPRVDVSDIGYATSASGPNGTGTGESGDRVVINFLAGSIVVGDRSQMSDVREAAEDGVRDAMRAKGER